MTVRELKTLLDKLPQDTEISFPISEEMLTIGKNKQEEVKTFSQEEFETALKKLENTYKLEFNGNYHSDFGILKIAKTPETDGTYMAYSYSGECGQYMRIKIQPQYAEDIIKYYCQIEEKEKVEDTSKEIYLSDELRELHDNYNDAIDRLWNCENAYKILEEYFEIEEIIKKIHNNEDINLSAFAEDKSIFDDIQLYMSGDKYYDFAYKVDTSDLTYEEQNKCEDKLYTISHSRDIKTTKELCAKIYDFMQEYEKTENKDEIEIDR